jgi:hypothetical protein
VPASLTRSGAVLTWSAAPASAGPGVVYVTRLYLKGLRDVPAFFRASLAIRRQAMRSAGARSLVLHARPFARTFTTVSWWDDEAAVRAFVRAEPHRASMARWGPRMADFSNESFPGTPGVPPTMAVAAQPSGAGD